MIEFVLIAIVVGTAWFLHDRKKISALQEKVTSPNTKTKLQPVLGIVAIIIVFLAWDWFKVWFAEWFVASDVGEILGWSAQSVAKWLWVVVAVGVLLAVLWLVPNKIWGSLSSAVVGVIATIFIIFSLMTGETMLTWSEGGSSVKCTTQDELDNIRISKKGLPIVYCPEEGPLHLYATYGYRPKITWQEKFYADHPQEMRNWQLSDFIRVTDGVTTTSRSIYPVRVNLQRGEQSAYAGLPYIVLYAQAGQ